MCISLTQVIFTSGLTILGNNMFNMNGGATQLGSVTIPSTITKIGEELLYCFGYSWYYDYCLLSVSLFSYTSTVAVVNIIM